VTSPASQTAPPIPSAGRPGEAPAHCVARLTRASGTSFYYAFVTLPRPRREAIFAVYAFCRAVDSAVDEAESHEHACMCLDHWKEELEGAFSGGARDPLAVRVGQVAAEFELPKHLFEEVVRGVSHDLEPRRFETWRELEEYCDLVAGAVGRLCVRIFGHREPWADRYAQELGLALQITNILRDIGPDARNGRFYLPQEDLDRWDLTEEDVLGGDPRRLGMLRAEARRAREHYRRADELGARAGRELAAARIMGAIYRRLLQRVERAGFPTEDPVVRVPRLEKAMLASWALLGGPWRAGVARRD
jgi:phytoene synthase